MKRIVFLTCIFTVFSTYTFTQNFKHHVMPMVGFDTVQTGDEDFVLSPSARVQFMSMKNEEVVSPLPDRIMLAAGYSQDYYTSGLGPDKVKRIHGCSLMAALAKEKNSGTFMLMSNGEVPFSSLKTLTGVAMYSHEMIKTDEKKFNLGFGVIVGDFYFEDWDFTLYVIPLPTFSFTYKNDVFETKLAVQGPPSISFTLFPESMVRFKSAFGMGGYKSIRDLTFDCALAFYPLANNEDEGKRNFLSISAGVMNTKSDVTLKDNKKYGMQYYTAYGEVNATILKVRCGYNFDGKQYVDNKETGDLKKGLYLSAMLMAMF